MAYWKEDLKINNGRGNGLAVHNVGGAIGSGASSNVLISGLYVADYDKVSVNIYNGGSPAVMRFQIWGSNASGGDISGTNSPLFVPISGGAIWQEFGNPFVLNGNNSTIKSFETTRFKFIAVNGSGSVPSATGVNIDVFAVTKA